MQAEPVELVEKDGRRYVAGTAGTTLLAQAKYAVDLVGLCGSYQSSNLLLYPENLPAGFFDLSTGDAGEILQKLRTYRIRLAVVVAPDRPMTSKFAEMAAEERRSNYFRVCAGRDEAEEWLLHGSN